VGSEMCIRDRSITGYVVVILVILFQPELRRGIAQLGEQALLGQRKRQETASEIAAAAVAMARRRRGALIAIERDFSLDAYVDNAVRVDGQVTRLLLDDHAYGLSRRRVTISTAGLVPQIRRLGEDCNAPLAVSLHAPTDDLRDELVPINRRHPIAELLDACWQYAEVLASRQVTFEYVMLDGVNDSLAEARALIGLLRNRPAKVNLIPFNSFDGGRFRCSSQETIDAFWQTLNAAGIVATIRRPRGDDIAAACGQLAGRVDDRRRTKLSDKLSGVTSS